MWGIHQEQTRLTLIAVSPPPLSDAETPQELSLPQQQRPVSSSHGEKGEGVHDTRVQVEHRYQDFPSTRRGKRLSRFPRPGPRKQQQPRPVNQISQQPPARSSIRGGDLAPSFVYTRREFKSEARNTLPAKDLALRLPKNKLLSNVRDLRPAPRSAATG